MILKFIRQLISILVAQVETPGIALRLSLLAAQISDECGFEDLTYDFYVQAFTVYEDSISESRAQLQAITLIIGTLSGAKVFNIDNYDILITKAALHGARLLNKCHQVIAIGLASHLWWQEPSFTEIGTKLVGGEEKFIKQLSKEGEEDAKSVGIFILLSFYLDKIAHSIPIRTVSVSWNASRNPFG